MENRESPLLLTQETNCFVIDWLTFVSHGESVDYIKWLLGLDSPDIPWEESLKFRNGYPCSLFWNGITISFGADDERFYDDPSKVRKDMGVCVNLSGCGCRAFESYGSGDWIRLLGFLFRDTSDIAADQHRFISYNVTRIDLAFDDHTGILDIHQMENDTRNRHYVSRATYAKCIWSDKKKQDIKGMTIQVGADSSDIKIRIYNKAAERDFNDRHWIRVEIQLRNNRALSACKQLLESKHIGKLTSGILRNYLTFREPSEDSNPSRWPIASYWSALLLGMERISLWTAPGEPYNFSNTEYWLIKQYGPAIVVLDRLTRDPEYLVNKCKQIFPLEDLPPKYKSLLAKGGDF